MRPLGVLLPDGSPEQPASANNPRTSLAQWIVDPENPLTARVMVNRIWHYHFGRGIVATPNDFGRMGVRPTHPELLDYLANEFVAGGSIEADTPADSAQQHLPAIFQCLKTRPTRKTRRTRCFGSLIAGGLKPRIRDAMLAVSGASQSKDGRTQRHRADRQRTRERALQAVQWAVTPDPTEHTRRSIYLMAKRNLVCRSWKYSTRRMRWPVVRGGNRARMRPQALELLNGAFAESARRNPCEAARN